MKGFVVAGTHSGVGKTTIAIGLMSAYKKRGLNVQPFKVGPDFIDPFHHTVAAEKTSHNLDGWMLSKEMNQNLFYSHSKNSDLSIIEGVMGLFDGYRGKSEAGSTAQMAKWLGLPVILVIDASAMSRSVAAMVKGYMEYDPELNVCGVILNRVAGETHLQWLKEAIEESLNIRVLGGIPKDQSIYTEERHLGLHLPSEKKEFQIKKIERIEELVEKCLDLNTLYDGLNLFERIMIPTKEKTVLPRFRVGVARDQAFCFYYEDNIRVLEEKGAEIVYFSPLKEELPLSLDMIYLGGGYPELYAKALSSNQKIIEQIREFGFSGGRIYAECGGLIYLSKAIQGFESEEWPLVGVFDFKTKMREKPKLGYVEVSIPESSFEGQIKGHFFHYSEIFGTHEEECCYHIKAFSQETENEGFVKKNVLASYMHLHFRSSPNFIDYLLEPCRATLKA